MFDVLSTEWRKLALANFVVDPEILRPFLPAGTELDLYDNKCFVTLIGFVFSNVKVLGIDVPLHQEFEEVNLRFYVTNTRNGKVRRGIVFLRELVSKHVLTFLANSLYFENYRTLPMKHESMTLQDLLNVSYSWKINSNWQTASFEAEQKAVPVEDGSETDFLLHRFQAYTKVNDGRTIEHEISHPKWDHYPVKSANIKVDFGTSVAQEFAFLNNMKPDSLVLAEGSAVKGVQQNFLNF